MEKIRDLPQMERPREKLQYHGAKSLSDQELLAILLGSGTPKVPLHLICENLLKDTQLADIGQLDMEGLCRFKGIGPAKAAILLAATELTRRSRSRLLLTEQDRCEQLRSLLEKQDQLQYILLLISARQELLAFSETGSLLPDIARITGLAVEAGAARILLGRNGWPAFSNAESRYMAELRAACTALHIVCEGLMIFGPERY